MPTASIPSFWSHPIAATRAYSTTGSLGEAVELTVMFTLMPYYIYFWVQHDEFFMNLIAASFILVNSSSILRGIIERRVQVSFALPTVCVFLGLWSIWHTLTTALART